MARKHLHELLKEDQEPFHLKSFISDRRSLLKSTTTDAGKLALQPTKRNRTIESTSSATTRNFCLNNACLFSFQDSPEFKKPQFLDFPAREIKSPCNNTTFFLHIPASTAAMLLDAAMRIQKPKSGSKHIGFGLLGSFLRRLKERSTRTKAREIGPVYVTPSSSPNRKGQKKRVSIDMEANGDGELKGLAYSCNNNSSGDWSEKSSEKETSCSLRSILDSQETEWLPSNPSSPFRFSLQRSPSPPRRKPDSTTSVASPSRHFQQYEEEICDVHPQDTNDGEKEQCSPVSVLDTLFDDSGVLEDNDYDIDCNYANVQRAKHQLLQTLQRFERLAGLDPIKLEKHMLDQCCDEEEDECYNEDVTLILDGEFVRDIADRLGVRKIPWYMKKLLFDLIEEEKNQEHQAVVQRVCKRFHSWKVVELNTIDMMIKADFKNEGWARRDKETIREIGMDIERAIFGFMVEELTEEIVISLKN